MKGCYGITMYGGGGGGGGVMVIAMVRTRVGRANTTVLKLQPKIADKTISLFFFTYLRDWRPADSRKRLSLYTSIIQYLLIFYLLFFSFSRVQFVPTLENSKSKTVDGKSTNGTLSWCKLKARQNYKTQKKKKNCNSIFLLILKNILQRCVCNTKHILQFFKGLFAFFTAFKSFS